MHQELTQLGRIEREPFRVLVEPRILTEYFDFRESLRRHGLTRT